MALITIDPTFEWDDTQEKFVLVSHRGQYLSDASLRFDRGVQKQASNLGQQAGSAAGGAQANASQLYSSIVPGLEREAQTPQGFTPEQLNNQLVASQQAVGGGNAALQGEGRLAALRTRTAGGFTPALDEAARAKGRQLSTNAVGIQNANARLGLQRQQSAQEQLESLYHGNLSAMLQAMGLQNQDLNTQLKGGQSGWLQNTDETLAALGGLGKGVGGAAAGFG